MFKKHISQNIGDGISICSANKGIIRRTLLTNDVFGEKAFGIKCNKNNTILVKKEAIGTKVKFSYRENGLLHVSENIEPNDILICDPIDDLIKLEPANKFRFANIKTVERYDGTTFFLKNIDTPMLKSWYNSIDGYVEVWDGDVSNAFKIAFYKNLKELYPLLNNINSEKAFECINYFKNINIYKVEPTNCDLDQLTNYCNTFGGKDCRALYYGFCNENKNIEPVYQFTKEAQDKFDFLFREDYGSIVLVVWKNFYEVLKDQLNIIIKEITFEKLTKDKSFVRFFKKDMKKALDETPKYAMDIEPVERCFYNTLRKCGLYSDNEILYFVDEDLVVTIGSLSPFSGDIYARYEELLGEELFGQFDEVVTRAAF